MMAASRKSKKHGRARFIELFREVTASGFENYRVWSAFVTIFATETLSAIRKAPAEMAEDADRLKKQFAEHTERLAGMYAALIEEFESNNNQDLLGSLFMELGIGAKDKGQFFTPYNLAHATAKLSLNIDKVRASIDEKGFVTVNDPAVGGGAMLVAAFNALNEAGVNPQTQAWFEGQDISTDTGFMAYLSLAIIGAPGCIVIGDTLTMERRMVLPLPMNVIEPLWTARYLKGAVPC